jgi:uncharacterized protein
MRVERNSLPWRNPRVEHANELIFKHQRVILRRGNQRVEFVRPFLWVMHERHFTPATVRPVDAIQSRFARLKRFFKFTHLDACTAIVDDESVSLDWKCEPLAEGLACYRRNEFFEAHEHWEGVWLHLQEPEKSFLQALIQLTAAFHHLQAGNRAGTASLLRRVLLQLEVRPAHFAGIAVAPLLAEVREWLHALESEGRPIPPAFPKIRPGEWNRG